MYAVIHQQTGRVMARFDSLTGAVDSLRLAVKPELFFIRVQPQ